MSESHSMKKNFAFAKAALAVTMIAGATGIVPNAVAQTAAPQQEQILFNGQAGTVKVGGHFYSFFNLGGGKLLVNAVDGQHVANFQAPNNNPATMKAISDRFAEIQANGVSSTPAAYPTEVATANAPTVPAVPTATSSIPPRSTSIGVQFFEAGHFIDRQANGNVVEINGNHATVAFAESPNTPLSMDYQPGGIGKGIIGSVSGASGRNLTTNGGWIISGYDSRRGGRLPGRNGDDNVILKEAKAVIAAMEHAKAAATNSGQTYKPVGEASLRDLVSAHGG